MDSLSSLHSSSSKSNPRHLFFFFLPSILSIQGWSFACGLKRQLNLLHLLLLAPIFLELILELSLIKSSRILFHWLQVSVLLVYRTFKFYSAIFEDFLVQRAHRSSLVNLVWLLGWIRLGLEGFSSQDQANKEGFLLITLQARQV